MPLPELPYRLTLADFDRDGILQDTLARSGGMTRAEFLRVGALGTGALLLTLGATPAAAQLPSGDFDILNFDLAWEYLQASFYTEAEELGTVDRMDPAMARWARTFGAHERAHVRILKSVLGPQAVKKPRFDFHGTTENIDAFTKTVVAFEELTTALLLGQAPRLEERELVAALFSLLTVEARHVAWVRHQLGINPPVISAFDDPKSMADADGLIASTNFTAKPLRTIAKGAPRFTG